MLPLRARVDLGAMAIKRYSTSPQSSNITGVLPSDCLVSYPGHSLGGVLPLCREAVVYSTAPADWARVCVCVYTYIYICVCVCVYLYIYICVCVYVYIYIYVYVHVYMYTCMYIYVQCITKVSTPLTFLQIFKYISSWNNTDKMTLWHNEK